MSESADRLDGMRQAFKTFDKNGNGEIEVSELKEVMQWMGQNPTDLDVQMMIKEYDLDKNGTINFPEFCEMMKNRIKTAESRRAELRVAFQMFDRNGDGKISCSELMEAMTKLGEKLTVDEAQEMIDEVDVNQDGFIDYGEFVRMYGSDRDPNTI